MERTSRRKNPVNKEKTSNERKIRRGVVGLSRALIEPLNHLAAHVIADPVGFVKDTV
ncbi:hypothetical protein RvY_10205 [Ramazzottius varieornatus]|uniref:Uncharacterized protein n=1 Tax=Ramazzottius varieornatus TaxID=947166 RepID=A0A1D1VL09_RAMVA|nr:hypothetical protein RvY_10205 [Ramazzottius varieornatus]